MKTANILNKHSKRTDRGWSYCLGVKRRENTAKILCEDKDITLVRKPVGELPLGMPERGLDVEEFDQGHV
jgi:hypothetical protein